MDLKYKEVYGSEHATKFGAVGVKILISTSVEVDKRIDSECCRSAEAISDAILEKCVASDPEEQESVRINKEKILECFPSKIFVEEIPNQYCNRWCCKHRPWFIITTEVGRFRVGWRKRVMSLDWSGTNIGITAEGMFPNENTTRYDKTIHAWSYADLARYVSELIGYRIIKGKEE